MNNEEKFNILICGSQRFDDENFVYGMLDAFYDQVRGNISNIITSRSSGTCQFAKEWVEWTNDEEKTNILVKEFEFDMALASKNQSLYEQIEIPDVILRNDEFFQKGKDSLISSGANLIFAFPNKEGILGASTLNIKRFAQLADRPFLDCSEALELINAHRSQKKMKTANRDIGLVNRHPNKKL